MDDVGLRVEVTGRIAPASSPPGAQPGPPVRGLRLGLATALCFCVVACDRGGDAAASDTGSEDGSGTSGTTDGTTDTGGGASASSDTGAGDSAEESAGASAGDGSGETGDADTTGDDGVPPRDDAFDPALLEQSGCQLTDLGLTPLHQYAANQTYNGFAGGLYSDGNAMPAGLRERGAQIAGALEALGPDGSPAPGGRVVLVSLGMSNTHQEFDPFVEAAQMDAAVNPDLAIVNLAMGGHPVLDWGYEPRPGKEAWDKIGVALERAGVTAEQVQVAWVKQAFSGPAQHGTFPDSAEALRDALDVMLERAAAAFPNLKLVYISSRTRAYTTLQAGLSPEPYAYEGGFAVKWLVEDYASGTGHVPWLAWGPYLWDDEAHPREDGYAWECGDTRSVPEMTARGDVLDADSTHPSMASGRAKVGAALLEFFKNDPTTAPWFLD